MKFYKDKNNYLFWQKITQNKLTAIYSYYIVINYKIKFMYIKFIKNNYFHNIKDAAFISKEQKHFFLNNEFYGNENNFTKKSWRRFVKLQAFL